MTDLEITKLCAEAMGDSVVQVSDAFGERYLKHPPKDGWSQQFDPLFDDAQAMALIKKFRLFIHPIIGPDFWVSPCAPEYDGVYGRSFDLNRAICECVAKMQKEKNG